MRTAARQAPGRWRPRRVRCRRTRWSSGMDCCRSCGTTCSIGASRCTRTDSVRACCSSSSWLTPGSTCRFARTAAGRDIWTFRRRAACCRRSPSRADDRPAPATRLYTTPHIHGMYIDTPTRPMPTVPPACVYHRYIDFRCLSHIQPFVNSSNF